MKFDFTGQNGLCWYRIICSGDKSRFVDVLMYEPPELLATKGWSYSVEEREVLLAHIGLFGDMPQEVKDYIDKLLNMKAFW